MTVREITRLFNAEKVPTPSAIKNSQGYYHKWRIGVEGVDLWSEEAVIILRDERYLGKTVYGKRYRPQVGNWQTLKNSRTDWIVVEERHEPLVSAAKFQKAQDHLKEYYIQTLMDEKEMLLKAGNSDILASLQKQVTVYQGACAKIDEQKAELYDAMANERISREKYQREREKLSREQENMTD